LGSINSPLGKTEFKSRQARQFSVPDESGQQPQQQQPPMQEEQRFTSTQQVAPPQQGQSQQHQSESVSWEEAQVRRNEWAQSRQQAANVPSSKTRIEMLVGIGRSSIDIPVRDDTGIATFTVSTLKSKERKHIARARDNMFKLKTQDSVMEVKTVTLAYAVQSIDGISLDAIISSEVDRVGEADRFYMREAFIDELDDNVTNFLFEHFEHMDVDNQKKYSIKSTEDVKVVAEAISKSS